MRYESIYIYGCIFSLNEMNRTEFMKMCVCVRPEEDVCSRRDDPPPPQKAVADIRKFFFYPIEKNKLVGHIK